MQTNRVMYSKLQYNISQYNTAQYSIRGKTKTSSTQPATVAASLVQVVGKLPEMAVQQQLISFMGS